MASSAVGLLITRLPAQQSITFAEFQRVTAIPPSKK
jgi:hypothetical protein